MPSAKTVGTRLKHLVVEGAYIPREYYVFDDRELVYIPIYKVASTSIKTALIRPRDGASQYPEYMAIHDEGSFGRHSLLNPRQRAYFKFSFVRDPFTRLVSCYEDRVRRPIYAPIGRYYFDTAYNRVLIRRLFGSEFSQDMSFEAFVNLVAKIPDWLADGHFKSQYGWIYRFGRPIPDYVGRLETLAEDWRPLAARFGLPEPEHRNRSNQQDIASYFTTERLVALAAKRYRKDIELFGYDDSYVRLLAESRARDQAALRSRSR